MKPRVPFYLRAKSPKFSLPEFAQGAPGAKNYDYTYVGNLVRCNTCRKFFREIDLTKNFSTKHTRADECCPYCRSSNVYVFPDLTPAQEALLDG